MKKRTFIKLGGSVLAGTLVSPLVTCTPQRGEEGEGETGAGLPGEETGTFTLPDLPYDYAALEPHIDARTMEIHHSKHHAGYVRKLNDALGESSLAGLPLGEILQQVTPEQTAIRNNGGGHYNHSLFWQVMSGNGGGQPTGVLAEAIDWAFGSFESFTEQFSTTAASVFGSGWAWLCLDQKSNLFITSTPNQDNPLMTRIVEKNGKPILGIDVWEHAYYLKYQNRRTEYIRHFLQVIDWNRVTELFEEGF